jgi:tripartite-type tricarboxylate transporter receptor subunit TctC
MIRFAALLLASACALAPALSHAQAFPSRAVRIIVPFPPGGTVDVLGRAIGQKLGEKWKQSVVVENKPGAGTVVGTGEVARSAPDGHTLLVAVTAHAVNATLYAKLPFDPVQDFAPLSMVATTPNMLIVHPSVQANTVAELIAFAKANPGAITFASPGSGTAMHLAGELFKSMAGIDIVHVPYKGTPPALNDLVAGTVKIMFDTGVTLPHVKAGRLKAIAVTSPKRAVLTPELPTMAESGLPGFDVVSWYALLAPAGTPAPIVDQLSRDINDTLRDPEVRERLARIGLETVGTTPAVLDRHIRAEIARWGKVVRDAGAKAD